jgi:hypothetical protein
MGVSCKRLGLKMLDWHGGGGTATYAAGSSLFAGRRISRELADRAASELAPSIPEARARKHGWTAKDARSLASIVRQLRRGSCT